MKKTYFIVTVIVLVIAALGFSNSSVFLENAASSKSAEVEKTTTSVGDSKVDSITIAPAFEEKHQNIFDPETKPMIIAETKQKFINDLKSAVNDQIPPENAPAPDYDINELIHNLNDPSSDNDSREDSAKALIKSGTKEGVLSVLKAISNAHVQQDYDLKDSLMQVFAGVDSVQAADLLADVLTGKAPFSSELPEMPKDITDAINNAIRLMPNEDVGEMLAQKYTEASEEEKKKLLDIKHPVMIARMAADAFGLGDNETAGRLIVELAGVENNLAIKGIMILAREQSISLDNVTNMLSSCSFMNSQDDQTHFMFVGYLGNAEFSPEERSLAAYAMASENDKEMAISALKKAQLFEEDPLVKQYIEDALSRIDYTSQNS
ncbi:MAG: hypothetical protein WCR46_24930 [Deltaproteobacteria bacterium]|jgi:hypothetical protein